MQKGLQMQDIRRLAHSEAEGHTARGEQIWLISARVATRNEEESMKKPARKAPGRDEMYTEYDFSVGVRGKYAEQFRSGTNVVLLEPDVADAFPDAKSVNDALRGLIAVARRARDRKQHS